MMTPSVIPIDVLVIVVVYLAFTFSFKLAELVLAILRFRGGR
jgi:hypothetical protein